MAPGFRLTAPGEGRTTVLGKPARVLEAERPNALALKPPLGYALLFDPLPKAEAEALYEDLCNRAPLLAYRQHVALSIHREPLQITPIKIYNGPLPTLISL